ncbi:MAG: EamA family transporter [Gaiellales bacterium]
MTTYRTGALLVIVATTLFALNGIVARIAMDGGLPPVSVAAFRTVGGALFLLPFVVAVWRRFTRAMLLPIVAYASIGIFASQGLYFQSLSYLDVALALVLSYLAPIPVAIYQHVRRGEKLPPYAYVVMLLAIAGVALSVLAGSGGVGAVSAIGLAFGLATMITFAAMVVLSTTQPAELGPMARAGAPLVVAALLYLIVVPPWTFPWDRLGDVVTLAGRVHLEVPLWTTLIWVVVLGSVVPFALVLAGNARVGSGAASMLGMTEPVVGSIAAWVILGQVLTFLQIVGILITVVSVGVVEHARSRFIHQVELPGMLPPLGDDDPR